MEESGAPAELEDRFEVAVDAPVRQASSLIFPALEASGRRTPEGKRGAGMESSMMDVAGSFVAKGMGGIVSQISHISQHLVQQVGAIMRNGKDEGHKGEATGFRKSGTGASSVDSDQVGEVLPARSVLSMLRRRTSMALQIIIENPRKISECYNVEEKELGHGAFGSVRKARVKATGAVRAVKFVAKARMIGKEVFLKAEIEILKMLDHPNIVKLYELFEDTEHIYMVMELCSGGALQDHLKLVGRFTELQTAKATVQILRAVYYLHAKDIAHRDMKPGNCLMVSRDLTEKGSLRVTDFGLSCRCVKGQVLMDRVGTLGFMAPQVIERKYDKLCDVWSCGVTMYMLLCGYAPFRGKTDDEVRKKVCSGVFQFDPAAWLDMSENCMSLIRRLLKVDPQQRSSVQEALRCEWLRKKAAEAEVMCVVDETMLRNLRGFRSLNKFKKAALCVIASLLDEEQTKEARDAFIALDTDDDGMLTHKELRERLERADEMNCSPSEDAFCSLDHEPYTYTEFLAATFDRHSFCQRGVCWAAFNAFDINADGTISQQELSRGRVLGKLSKQELERLVQDFDANGDGGVDFQEFMAMMRDGEGWTPSPRTSPRSSVGRFPSSRVSSRGASPRSITTVNSAVDGTRSTPASPQPSSQAATAAKAQPTKVVQALASIKTDPMAALPRVPAVATSAVKAAVAAAQATSQPSAAKASAKAEPKKQSRPAIMPALRGRAKAP